MKERLTYFLPKGSDIDPKSIRIENGNLNYTNYNRAWIEKRFTWSLAEIDDKYAQAISDSHELHIRWIRPGDFTHAVALPSRLAAGLHVFYTPRDAERKTMICSLLKKLFGIDGKCSGPNKSFSTPRILSERFAHTANFQYFRTPDEMTQRPHWLFMICPPDLTDAQTQACRHQAHTLTEAVEVHLDYDAISNSVVMTAIWTPNTSLSVGSGQDLAFDKLSSSNSGIEIGILSAEKAEEPEEIKLGGYLIDLDDAGKPSPTLFSFPSRHHSLPSGDQTRFNLSYNQPTGLHPELAITLSKFTKPPRDTCALHAYFTLPSAVFFDRYQLSEEALLRSKNIRALRALSGAEDLEAPDWAIQQWGSAALFELASPTLNNASKQHNWQIQIPLHLRYLQQDSSHASYYNLSLPWPVLFWACEAEEGLKMSTNPFDRTNLGYDGLFGPKTMFYHIPPVAGSSLATSTTVPTLSDSHGVWLPTATLTIVLAGLVWVLISLLRPLPSPKQHQPKPE